MSMGQLWGALVPVGFNWRILGIINNSNRNDDICTEFLHILCPRGTTYTPLRGMFSHSLIASSNVVIHMFLRNSRSELRLVKVGRNVKSMGFFGRFFAPCTIIVRPIAYKRYSTPFLNKPHDLTPHSWVCDKRCRRSSEPKFCPEEEE